MGFILKSSGGNLCFDSVCKNGAKYTISNLSNSSSLVYKKKGWKDARIHFAVNCASVGCPPLLKTVYEAKSLDKTLDSNIKKAFFAMACNVSTLMRGLFKE